MHNFAAWADIRHGKPNKQQLSDSCMHSTVSDNLFGPCLTASVTTCNDRQPLHMRSCVNINLPAAMLHVCANGASDSPNGLQVSSGQMLPDSQAKTLMVLLRTAWVMACIQLPQMHHQVSFWKQLNDTHNQMGADALQMSLFGRLNVFTRAIITPEDDILWLDMWTRMSAHTSLFQSKYEVSSRVFTLEERSQQWYAWQCLNLANTDMHKNHSDQHWHADSVSN